MTFLCGSGGVYALGAVVANHIRDYQRRDMYLDLFLEVLILLLPKSYLIDSLSPTKNVAQ